MPERLDEFAVKSSEVNQLAVFTCSDDSPKKSASEGFNLEFNRFIFRTNLKMEKMSLTLLHAVKAVTPFAGRDWRLLLIYGRYVMMA
jgi:hypothetical protein